MGRFLRGSSGQVLDRRSPGHPDSRQAPRPGPSRLLRSCRRRRRCRGCCGSGRAGVVAGPESPSRPLFLPEETSFLGRTLTPVVSRGSPCGHLYTQWRCLCLPPIPSIRMSVSASAAPCPPPGGPRARSARSRRTVWTPGRAEPFLFTEALSVRVWRRLGACRIFLKTKKGGRLRESGK